MIKPILALSDNYIWAIHGMDLSRIIVVDPGEAKPVLDYCYNHHLTLDGILLTHHHWDHTNGVQDLLRHFPNIPVYSSKTDTVDGVTETVKEGQTISFDNLSSPIEVLDIPGHTLGHLAYLYEGALFCGDTLFSCGCGKLFEGTPADMVSSLRKIKNLPSETLIYCGHEYTEKNIEFAQLVDPNNSELLIRKMEVESLRRKNQPSLPALLKTELQTNPFLRWDNEDVIKAVQKQANIKTNDPIIVFQHLREWKNQL